MFVLFSASSNWVEITLIPEAGSQSIWVTGFEVFPVAGALLLLQSFAVVVSLLSKELVGRIVRLALLPIVMWQVISGFIDLSGDLKATIAAKVTDLTGISGESAQGELISQMTSSIVPNLYLLALVINIFALLVTAAIPGAKPPPKPNRSPTDADDVWELWESQR